MSTLSASYTRLRARHRRSSRVHARARRPQAQRAQGCKCPWRRVPTGGCPEEGARRRVPGGGCPEEGARRRVPGGGCAHVRSKGANSARTERAVGPAPSDIFLVVGLVKRRRALCRHVRKLHHQLVRHLIVRRPPLLLHLFAHLHREVAQALVALLAAVRTLHALLLGGGICARHVQFQWNRKVTHPPYTHPHPE